MGGRGDRTWEERVWEGRDPDPWLDWYRSIGIVSIGIESMNSGRTVEDEPL